MSKNQQNAPRYQVPLNYAQQQAQFPQPFHQIQAIPNQPYQTSLRAQNPIQQMVTYPQQYKDNINPIWSQQYQVPPPRQQQLFPNHSQQFQIYQQQSQYQQYQPFIEQNNQYYEELIYGPFQHKIYNDDDEIYPMVQNNQTAQYAVYDLIGNLELSINAQYKMLKLKKNQIQYLPAMVTLKAKEQLENNSAKQTRKFGVDLICIIDKSGSMRGEKIKMVKQSLKLLLNFLTEKDRLCLISYADYAQRLTPLKKTSPENKIYFQKKIDQIIQYGGTSIEEGTFIAFEQIKKRKYRNNATSIFLLSDGQDDMAEKSELAVKGQIRQFDEPFTINSFGFGQDHDAKMMTSLCNLKNGSFYFVNDISLLDEFFVDALGGLQSVVGENIEISVKLTTQAPFDGIKILKTYGKMWQKTNELNYKIKIPQFTSGSRKDYVFELLLPKFDAQIGDHQRVAQVMNAIVTIKSAQTEQIITKQANLNLTLFSENEQLPVNEENIDVAAQFYRVKGADIIDDAKRVGEQGQFQNAQVMIDTIITKINKNQKVAKASEGIIQELILAKQYTQSLNFQIIEIEEMYSMIPKDYAQAGINASFNPMGIQQPQLQPGSYQNNYQATWVGEVQMSKKQK